jgi:hypothetical protein
VAMHWNEDTKKFDKKGPVSRTFFYKTLRSMKKSAEVIPP